MKSPLIYLTAVKLKNQLIGVVKSPAKLIYALFLVAIFALSAFSGNSMETGEFRDFSELVSHHDLVLLLYVPNGVLFRQHDQ